MVSSSHSAILAPILDITSFSREQFNSSHSFLLVNIHLSRFLYHQSTAQNGNYYIQLDLHRSRHALLYKNGLIAIYHHPRRRSFHQLYKLSYLAYSMAIIPMLQNEPFPHKYRSVAWGYIEGLSQIGNFITPYIVTAC